MDTDFLKSFSKSELSRYSYYALCNLYESTCCSWNEDEYNQMMSKYTSDIKGYINVLSLMLRYIGVSCIGLQDKYKFNMDNETFFETVLDRLQERYSSDVLKRTDNTEEWEKVTNCDLSKLVIKSHS